MVAAELAGRGHVVTWWTSRFDHLNKRLFPCEGADFPVAPGLTLRFLDGITYRKNVSIARLVNHWQIGAAFRRAATTASIPDVIVCSYPTIELSHEAVAHGQKHDVPVVLDIRDLWPDIFLDAIPAPVRIMGKMLLAPLFHQGNRALTGATALFAVSPGYLEWGLARAERGLASSDAAFPLAYERLACTPEGDSALLDRARSIGLELGQRVAVFIGTFGRTYDVSTVIGAARLLQDRADIQFVICGRGEREAEWHAEATGLTNVHFLGWLSAREISSLLARSWVGLAAYACGAPQGIPNKVIEYFSAGLPVLCSLPGETAQLLAKSGCGTSYLADNPEDLACKLSELDMDPSRHESMAAAATSVFDQNFSSDAVYCHMATHIEQIAGRSRR